MGTIWYGTFRYHLISYFALSLEAWAFATPRGDLEVDQKQGNWQTAID